MFRSITPKFINKIDAYLLVNHPVVWMSKIHYVLWHGALLWGFSALLGAIMPINLQSKIEYGLWYFLFTVIAVIILCIWVYRYVIFNKEKNYGSKKFSDEYKNFILVFISVTVFLLIPWPFEMIYSSRVANMYTDSEVLSDINKLNEAEPYMASSTNSYYSWQDSTHSVQYFNVRKLNPYASAYYTPYYLNTDSTSHPELLTAYQLAKKYKPTTDINWLKQKIETYISVSKKYNSPVDKTANELAERYVALLSKEKVTMSEFNNFNQYQYDLQVTMDNLCNAKFTTLMIFKSDYLWVIFYFVICISAFLMLFKITYWQQYLIMLVVLMLYPLLTFIFWQLLPYNSFVRSNACYEASHILLIIFSLSTIFVTANNHSYFKPFYNILNQVFYVTLIFSPLLVVAFLHDATNTFHNHDYTNFTNYDYSLPNNRPSYYTYLDTAYYQYWSDEYHRWMKIVKYSGIAAFVIALPFFKELFIKQIALPKKS
jgi:hypothetical protein